MEPHVSLDERLNQILTGFAQWRGDSEEASRLMAANAAVIAAMQAEAQSHSPQTSALAQQVIQAYQAFLDQVKAQQQEIKQELGRLYNELVLGCTHWFKVVYSGVYMYVMNEGGD